MSPWLITVNFFSRTFSKIIRATKKVKTKLIYILLEATKEVFFEHSG